MQSDFDFHIVSLQVEQVWTQLEGNTEERTYTRLSTGYSKNWLVFSAVWLLNCVTLKCYFVYSFLNVWFYSQMCWNEFYLPGKCINEPSLVSLIRTFEIFTEWKSAAKRPQSTVFAQCKYCVDKQKESSGLRSIRSFCTSICLSRLVIYHTCPGIIFYTACRCAIFMQINIYFSSFGRALVKHLGWQHCSYQ